MYTYAYTYTHIRVVIIIYMCKVPFLLSAISYLDIYASSHASMHAKIYQCSLIYFLLSIHMCFYMPSQASVCLWYVIAFLYICLHMHVYVNTHWHAPVATSVRLYVYMCDDAYWYALLLHIPQHCNTSSWCCSNIYIYMPLLSSFLIIHVYSMHIIPSQNLCVYIYAWASCPPFVLAYLIMTSFYE